MPEKEFGFSLLGCACNKRAADNTLRDFWKEAFGLGAGPFRQAETNSVLLKAFAAFLARTRETSSLCARLASPTGGPRLWL
jgi:hypothetical protein